MKIYDILGNEVASPVDEVKQPGKYSIQFDASNLSSGVYIYQLKSNTFVNSKRLVLIK